MWSSLPGTGSQASYHRSLFSNLSQTISNLAFGTHPSYSTLCSPSTLSAFFLSTFHTLSDHLDGVRRLTALVLFMSSSTPAQPAGAPRTVDMPNGNSSSPLESHKKTSTSTSNAVPGSSTSKKRKASPSRDRNPSMSHDPHTDDDAVSTVSRMNSKDQKRTRVHFSCVECHRRKQKCDRKEPCSQCVARRVPHLCRPFLNGVEDPNS